MLESKKWGQPRCCPRGAHHGGGKIDREAYTVQVLTCEPQLWELKRSEEGTTAQLDPTLTVKDRAPPPTPLSAGVWAGTPSAFLSSWGLLPLVSLE